MGNRTLPGTAIVTLPLTPWEEARLARGSPHILRHAYSTYGGGKGYRAFAVAAIETFD
jgi:hypothetical protein